MNNPKPILILIFVLTLAAIGYSQSTMSGRVVEVIDGKTVVIEISSGKLTAELQYIEVPEPEQPLHKTVREHLEKLVLGREVVFRAAGLTWGKTIGQLYVNSLDVSLQMLRDGAAWHLNPENNGQNEADSAAYQYHQNQAKAEQRGVWGIKDLKPASQFRAEKKEQARQAEIAAQYASKSAGEALYKATSEKKAPVVRRNGPWGDENPYLKNPGPLVHGYNAISKTGYVGTSLLGIKEHESQPADQKTAVDITYVYKQEEKSRKGMFIVSVVSTANDWRFLKVNNLVVLADGKTYMIGKPKRTAVKEDGKAVEKLTYEVSKSTIEKVANGGEVFVKIGDYMIYPTPTLQLLLYNMLQVAE